MARNPAKAFTGSTGVSPGGSVGLCWSSDPHAAELPSSYILLFPLRFHTLSYQYFLSLLTEPLLVSRQWHVSALPFLTLRGFSSQPCSQPDTVFSVELRWDLTAVLHRARLRVPGSPSQLWGLRRINSQKEVTVANGEGTVSGPSRMAQAGSIATGQSLVTALSEMLWGEAPQCWCDGVNERRCAVLARS